jgi:general secretion pathway protein G
MRNRTRSQGFTLIELLIVVVILGIIAAIVVPQFSIATSDAKESTLKSNLATVRSQLQLYKLEHNDQYPPMPGSGEPTLGELTSKTNDDHTATGTPTLGPYLLRLPNNPFYDGATALLKTKVVDSPLANQSAYYYDTADASNIVFRANDTEAHYDDF